MSDQFELLVNNCQEEPKNDAGNSDMIEESLIEIDDKPVDQPLNPIKLNDADLKRLSRASRMEIQNFIMVLLFEYHKSLEEKRKL